ncbi:MAG: hypothetical protein IID08_07690 [Candidatus Hydrogenedentes bacterium]|nr:hypothetical protein [Candidatus Hydrogenedentota bacterium]
MNWVVECGGKTHRGCECNRKIVIDEIVNLGINYPELKRPITDALRVLIQSNSMLSGKLQDNTREVFKSTMERGIFIKGGENPNPKDFLEMTEELNQRYGSRTG